MNSPVFLATINDTTAAASRSSSAGTGFIIGIILGTIFVSLIALFLYVVIAFIISHTVIEKGYTYEETHAFAKCFWLGVVGWIYVLALPDRKLHRALDMMGQELCALRKEIKNINSAKQE